jgi:hypothetical protein
MAGIAYLLIFVALVLVVGLVLVMVRFRSIGRPIVEQAEDEARRLLAEGKTDDALVVLYAALRANGWDYESFKAVKKIDQRFSIRRVEGGFIKLARTLRAMPKNNFDWVVEPLFLLGQIYKEQGNSADLTRLMLDLRRFVDDYQRVLSRVHRFDLLSRLSREQSELEFADRNYRSAIHMEAASYLHQVEAMHARGDLEGLEKACPYVPSRTMLNALAELEREGQTDAIGEIIQGGIVDGGARVELQRVIRDLDDAFKGQQTQSSRDRQMARVIYEKVLEKAEGHEK